MSIVSPILLRLKGLFPWKKEIFYFDEPLTRAVLSLAEQEGRSAEEMAADLIALALSSRASVEESYRRWNELTPREQQITAMVCLGYENRQISDQLGIAQDTVRSHQRKLLSKFHLRTKASLCRTLSPSFGWDFKAWEEVGFKPSDVERVLTKLIVSDSVVHSVHSPH